jgi:formylglycine-generating enzyme required for sulfatase activity
LLGGGNSDRKVHPVAQKQANAFGLYDMSGNVWEWTEDCYHDNYKGAPTDGAAWADDDCKYRVLRGGSWSSEASYASSHSRLPLAEKTTGPSYGFRPVWRLR